MSDFRFADIGWLHAAWAVLACSALLIVLEFRGRRLMDRMVSPLMQVRLVRKTSWLRKMIGVTLFGLSLVALVFALMRPQWGMTVQQMSRVDSQIMICLDVSKSMLAEDVVPNRLERAKAEIDSLLGLMDDNQQVGLTAFAGRASVLCPMTTDFGFLRLILREVEPSSVGLGGTKIGEAIQKAVDGFRETGDVNRIILLITDGEDHNSFPKDAAQQARDKGIRIVSVGFGDEAGAKIQITDSQTGVRSFVKDRNGVDVVSRLDGETLRDMAMITEGAYIPAGTGALDLQSIYDAHIRTLLQGSTAQEERVIRNEAYQWCVLAALILLIASLCATNLRTTSQRSFETAGLSRVSQTAVFWLVTAGCLSGPILAQDQSASSSQPSSTAETPAENADEGLAAEASQEGESPSAEIDETDAELAPRELYNQAVRYLSNDPERAERMLNEAKQQAGVDGELRYRALYNLGWVEVTRADALVESAPEDALKRFELAASRFREAIRVRSESVEARHNLEIVSRRILSLRDALAKKDPQDLAQRLDRLIEAQRDQQIRLQDQTSLMENIDPLDSELRSTFRRLSVEQRQILSDVQKLIEDTGQEVAALQQAKDDDQNGQSQIRAAQLTAMLKYLDQSSQRMTKARSFTRRMQSNRAFIRWAAALSASKRARDQLRNPIEVLGVLISDSSELAQGTQVLAVSQQPVVNGESLQAPSWLTTEYLSEAQTEIAERTSELREILAAGAATDSTEVADNQTEQLLANIRQAMPFLETAVSQFNAAIEHIDQSDAISAFTSQSEAIVALMEASEFFFDLRRLIEAMYRDELNVQGMVAQLSREPMTPLVSATLDLQAKNLKRADRLNEMLQAELQQLADMEADASNPPTTTPPATQPDAQAPSPEQLQAQRQRFELAKQVLAAAQSRMSEVAEMLKSTEVEDDSEESDGNVSNSSGLTDLEPSKSQTEQSDAVEDRGTDAASAEEGAKETGDASKNSEKAEASQTKHDDDTDSEGADQPVIESAVTDDSEAKVSEGNAADAGEAADADVAEVNDAANMMSSFSTESVDRAVERIQDLRRLFFSVVEHLRETTQRQSDLNDSVIQKAAGTGTDEIGSMHSQQRSLQQMASDIAQALKQQATQPPPVASDSAQPQPGLGQQSEDTQALVKASELVEEGSQAMQLAADDLQRLASEDEALPANGAQTSHGPNADVQAPEGDRDGTEKASPDSAEEIVESSSYPAEIVSNSSAVSPEVPTDDTPTLDYTSTIEQQQTAMRKLAEALALLDDQQSGQNQQQQNDQDEQQNSQEQPSDNSQPPQNMNAQQMLQAIRDREAQRRREKRDREVTTSSGVEKDW